MPPNRPSGWQSYMDYLSLNEDSLKELEDRAAQRASESDTEAAVALEQARRQSEASIRAGGQGELSGASSYGDYLRARQDAQRIRAQVGSGYEAAARESMRAGQEQPDYRGQLSRAEGSLSQLRSGMQASRAAMDVYQKRLAAERQAQEDAFKKSQAAMGPGYADREAYGRYSDAVQRSSQQARARGSSVRVISDEELNRWNQ